MAKSDFDTEFSKRHQTRITKAKLKSLLEARDERDELSALALSLQAELELVKLERDSFKADNESLTTERNIYRSLLENKLAPQPQQTLPSTPLPSDVLAPTPLPSDVLATNPGGTRTSWHRHRARGHFKN